MTDAFYSKSTASLIDFQVVRQFARLLRLQARILENEGQAEEAAALRARASHSERSVMVVN